GTIDRDLRDAVFGALELDVVELFDGNPGFCHATKPIAFARSRAIAPRISPAAPTARDARPPPQSTTLRAATARSLSVPRRHISHRGCPRSRAPEWRSRAVAARASEAPRATTRAA